MWKYNENKQTKDDVFAIKAVHSNNNKKKVRDIMTTMVNLKYMRGEMSYYYQEYSG